MYWKSEFILYFYSTFVTYVKQWWYNFVHNTKKFYEFTLLFKHKILYKDRRYEFLPSWIVIVSEYLLARQTYRNSRSGVVVGQPSAYYPENIDVINILLSVSIYYPDWHRLVLNKRRKIV